MPATILQGLFSRIFVSVCALVGVGNHFFIPQSHKIYDFISEAYFRGFMCHKGFGFVFYAQYQLDTDFKAVKVYLTRLSPMDSSILII